MSVTSLPPSRSSIPAFSSSRHAAQDQASSSSSSTHSFTSLGLHPTNSEGGLIFSTNASPLPSPLPSSSHPTSSSATPSTQPSTSSSSFGPVHYQGPTARSPGGPSVGTPPAAQRSPSSQRPRSSRSGRGDRDPLFQPIPDSTSFGSGGAAGKAWGVALHPPSPRAAPALTISYRSSPDPSQFPSFASLLRSMPPQTASHSASASVAPSLPPSSSSLSSSPSPQKDPAASASASAAAASSSSSSAATAATSSGTKTADPSASASAPLASAHPVSSSNISAASPAEATPAPSLISTHPSSPSLADVPDLSASVVTEATSVADLDPQSKVDATNSSSSAPQTAASPAPKKAAWGTPKSWADLASRGSAASVRQGAVGISVNFSEAGAAAPATVASEAGSPSRSPRTAGNGGRKGGSGAGLDTKRLAASQTKAPVRPAIMSLERLLADSHTAFKAPLVYPRGLVNTGNYCFANAILQMLVYCAPFYNLFALIGREVPADFGNATPLMEAVIYFLREFVLVEGRPKANGAAMQVDDDNDLVPNFAPGASEPFVPEFVYDAMRLNKRFDQMRRGHQEDAEEFLGFFLDTLHEELLGAIRRSAAKLAQSGSGPHSLLAKMSDEDKRLNGVTDDDLKRLGIKVGGGRDGGAAIGPVDNASMLGLALDDDNEVEEREVTRPVSPSEEGWMEVGQKGKTAFTRTTSTSDSPITRIFGGKLRSVLKCPGAKDSVTLEPYQPLQLDIQPPHVQSIEDALVNLTVPEVIPGVYSPAKAAHIDATKQVFIESLPPVLIVHLKRFVYDEVGGVQKSQKPLAYGTTLEIAGEALSPAMRAKGKQKYRLFGVVYHHGRHASGGHYTVDVLRQDGQSWLHIDDTTFSTIPAEQVVRTSAKSAAGHDGLAYLLFYKREDAGDDAASPATGTSTAVGTAAAASAGPTSVHEPKRAAAGGHPVVVGAGRAKTQRVPAVSSPPAAVRKGETREGTREKERETRKRSVPGWSQ